jgi:hypothetical protein
MRRKLVLVTILSLLVPTMAFAGRGGRGGGHGGGGHNKVVVRDHRAGGGGGRTVVRDHRSGPRHVRVNGGRYVFPGGVVRTYKRPVYAVYRNRHVRPAIIVEHYDPVPGYVWIGGGWTWGGAQWVWAPGYWSVAAEPVYVEPPSAGISVSAGVSIH